MHPFQLPDYPITRLPNPSSLAIMVRRLPMRGRLLFCAVGLAFCGADIHADVLTEEVPVPGGAAAFCRALGIDAPPDRASFLTELTRVVYTAPEAATTASLLRSLERFVESAPNQRPAVATDTVPVPLSTAVWSDVIFK